MYELIDPKTGSLTEKASLEILTRKKLEIENKLFFDRLNDERERYANETGDMSTYEDGNIKYYYKKGSMQHRIDSKKLKEERPDIAEEYTKEVETKGSWVLEIK